MPSSSMKMASMRPRISVSSIGRAKETYTIRAGPVLGGSEPSYKGYSAALRPYSLASKAFQRLFRSAWPFPSVPLRSTFGGTPRMPPSM